LDFKWLKWLTKDAKEYIVLQNNAQKYIDFLEKRYGVYHYIKSHCELLNYVVKIKGAINDQ